MKKLKIQFWKAEKALAMQILDQEGLSEEKSDGQIRIMMRPELYNTNILFLRGEANGYNLYITQISFSTNLDRDTYLDKMITAITNELFTDKGELKAGEICEVKDRDEETWKRRKLLAILPEEYEHRFIAGNSFGRWRHWDCVRPLTKRTEPKSEKCGQLITYTWEEK